jgi:hypothetical protein
MRTPKTKTKRGAGAKATIAMFHQLKREQIASVRVLIKAVPRMIAAQAEQMPARERAKLHEKIQHCKDRIRFCYLLYTDAAELLGPKPRWLTIA